MILLKSDKPPFRVIDRTVMDIAISHRLLVGVAMFVLHYPSTGIELPLPFSFHGDLLRENKRIGHLIDRCPSLLCARMQKEWESSIRNPPLVVALDQ